MTTTNRSAGWRWATPTVELVIGGAVAGAGSLGVSALLVEELVLTECLAGWAVGSGNLATSDFVSRRFLGQGRNDVARTVTGHALRIGLVLLCLLPALVIEELQRIYLPSALISYAVLNMVAVWRLHRRSLAEAS